MSDHEQQQTIDVSLDQTLFVLEADNYAEFVSALDNPPPAGSALKALMKRRPLWKQPVRRISEA